MINFCGGILSFNLTAWNRPAAEWEVCWHLSEVLSFIKSLVLLYYINNLINRTNTYLTGLSNSIEPANLLLIFWKDKTSCISWVTREIKSSVIKSVTKSEYHPKST